MNDEGKENRETKILLERKLAIRFVIDGAFKVSRAVVKNMFLFEPGIRRWQGIHLFEVRH